MNKDSSTSFSTNAFSCNSNNFCNGVKNFTAGFYSNSNSSSSSSSGGGSYKGSGGCGGARPGGVGSRQGANKSSAFFRDFNVWAPTNY